MFCDDCSTNCKFVCIYCIHINNSSLLLICFIYKTQVSAPGCRCSIKYFEMNNQIIDRHTLPTRHENRLILVHVHRERSHEKNSSLNTNAFTLLSASFFSGHLRRFIKYERIYSPLRQFLQWSLEKVHIFTKMKIVY